jgi:outer membrane receptor protein involved in Fe transport
MTFPQAPSARRHSWALAWCVLGLGAFAAVPLFAAEPAKKQLDVPADTATRAIKRLSEQSGVEVLFPSNLARDVRTNAVRGEFTPREALDQMLAGTGLVSAQDAATGALTVRREGIDPNGSRAAQATPASARPEPSPAIPSRAEVEANSTLVLSPFEVREDEDRGYLATSAQSGTRLRTELKDIAAAVSVVTKDFMNDIGARNLEDLLTYTTGTEVGGMGGNFSEAVNSALASGSEMSNAGTFENVSPGTRVRGLTSADNTRDFFTSGVPMDSYNVERVEITRGANAMLFGLGSPSGIINSSLIKADLRRNKTEVQYRTDEYGSYRGSLDHNQMLLKDRLALRFATVYDMTYYKIEPAFAQTQRGYLTGTYRPFNDTQIKVSGEWGQIDSNRPRNTPPIDNYTYWWDLGRPVYNLNTGVVRLLGTPTFRNPVTGGIVSPILPTGARNTNVLVTAEGTSGGTNNMTLIYSDPNSSALGIPGTTAVGYRSGQIANVRRNAAGALVTDGPMGLAGLTRILNQVVYAGHPTQNFWRNPVITDPGIYDFYNHMLDGPNKNEWSDWQTFNVALEQHFLKRTAGIELAFDRQRLDYGNVLPLASASAYTIRVDINESLPNGQPNPNFGRPLTVGFQTAKRTAEDSDTARATGYYNLSLRKVGPDWLGRALGTHQFTLSHTRNEAFRENYGASFAINSGVDYSLANQGTINDASTQGRAVSLIHYIGPNVSAFAMPGGGLTTPVGQMPVTGSVPILWAGADTRPDATSPASWVVRNYSINAVGKKDLNATRRASGIRRTEQQINSSSLVAQDRWFDGRIVTTLGWRRDDVHSFDAGTAPMDPATGIGVNDWDRLPMRKVGVQSERTFSWGGVAHAPSFITRHLPWGTELSLTVNRSDNFQPTGQRYNMFNDLIAPQMGTTKEYGALLSTLNGKLVLRYAHYETAAANTSITLPVQNYADLIEDVFDMIAKGANAGNPGLAPFQQWVQSPEGQATMTTFRVTPNAAGNDYDYDRRTGQVTNTSNVVSEGDEFELILNPTRNWRIAMNAAKSEAIRSDTGADFLRIANSLIPVTAGPAGGLLSQDNGNTLGTQFRQTVLVPLIQTTSQDGSPTSELRKWRYNLVTNYRFTESLAKGFSVGAAVRWQDKVAIGFPVIIDPVAGPVPDVKNPFYGPTETNVDAWIGYSRKVFGRYQWSIQLNVKNIGVGDELVPIWAQPDGSIASWRIAEPQKWTLTNTISF